MRKRDLVVAILAGCTLLPAADWLTDGGNPQRTGWQKDEKILSKSNVAGMKVLWKLQLDNQVRELHALFPAADHRRAQFRRHHPPGRHRLQHQRQHLRHRCRQGRDHLEDAFRQHLDAARGRARRRAALSRRADRDPGRSARRTRRQVHHLRHLLGRAPAPVECGRRRSHRAAHQLPAAQRQAVFAQPGQPLHLHHHRAGVRRQSEPRLHHGPERPHPQGELLRHVGWKLGTQRTLGGRKRRRLRAHRRRRIRSREQPLGAIHRGGEQGRLAQGLLFAHQRAMDVEDGSGHAGDPGALRLQGSQAAGHLQQGVPHLPAGPRRPGRRGPSHPARPHHLDVQRRGQLRGRRRVGQPGHLGKFQGHALAAEPDLGTAASGLQSPGDPRPGDARRHRGVEGGRAGTARS